MNNSRLLCILMTCKCVHQAHILLHFLISQYSVHGRESKMLLNYLLPLILLKSANSCDEEFTDYCALLGEDDIQGKKHGFMAGNKVYYVGGSSLVWRNTENETLGLTHPFFHDLRSRGTGIAYYEGVGTGNDFYGWEFHRETRVAYGSVVSEE